MIENLEYCKIKEVKSPERAHEHDAGIDFFIPTNITEEEFIKTFRNVAPVYETVTDDSNNKYISSITVSSGNSILIPMGIKVKVPTGHMLMFVNKSGIATKRSLVLGACVVDTGYEGEVFLGLHNIGNVSQTVYTGEKIAQAILTPISLATPKCIDTEDELFKFNNSDRGIGGFGSSGT